jgi:hypothetical protein
MLEPAEVVAEVLAFVLRVKGFHDANMLLVTVAGTLALSLLVLLSLRARAGEIAALFRIGCAKGMVLRMVAAELALALGAGVALAAAAGWAIARGLGRLPLP